MLTDLEADGGPVSPDGVARLVHDGADRDHAAQTPLASGQRGHAFIVDAVLEIHEDPVRFLEVLQGQGHHPLRVIGLHRDEDGIEGLGDRLQFMDVEGPHGDEVLAARAGETEPDLSHGLHVIGPLVDQGDVMPRLGQHAAHDAADRSHSDDADACAHEDCPFLKAGMTWAEKRSSCSRITACGVPTTCPTLTTSRPGYLC